MKGRTFVRVRARTEADGSIIPEALLLDGHCLLVDRVLECREAKQTKEGGSGTRYLVACAGAPLALFLDEERRWLMEDGLDVRQIPCDN